jgi:cytochrome c oxidase subunit 2
MRCRGGLDRSWVGRQAVRVVAAVAAFGLAGAAFAPTQGYVSAPYPWEMTLQESATSGMDRLRFLHDVILFPIITVISLFVLGLLIYVGARFREDRNPVPSAVTHHTGLEIAWTVIPILILVVIAVPSFRLLYYTDKIADADLTVKVVAHQWYWTYQYPDHRDAKNEPVSIDSRMVPEKDIKAGQIRLLAVDNELIVPMNQNVRVIMTSEDVMHGWAVPAFGMKRTVIPGRLNETWFNARKEGTFYGQCSQICGKDHTYMPIAVRVVKKDEFDKFIAERKATAALGAVPTTIAAAPAGTLRLAAAPREGAAR